MGFSIQVSVINIWDFSVRKEEKFYLLRKRQAHGFTGYPDTAGCRLFQEIKVFSDSFCKALELDLKIIQAQHKKGNIQANLVNVDLRNPK